MPLQPKKYDYSRPDDDTIAEALESCQGLLTPAAKILNTSRQSLAKWVRSTPALNELITQCRESFVDLAEAKLLQNINDGDVASIIFTLKTLGRQRGYVERLELSGPDPEITVRVVYEEHGQAEIIDSIQLPSSNGSHNTTS